MINNMNIYLLPGLLKPEMNILEDREPYFYFQSTNTTITNHPMVTDIFEVRTWTVRESRYWTVVNYTET